MYRNPTYVLAASLLVLMVCGVLAGAIAPAIGERPLDRLPLAVTTNLLGMLFTVVCARRNNEPAFEVAASPTRAGLGTWLVAGLPLVVPAIALLGARLIERGSTPLAAYSAIVGVVACAAYLGLRAPRLSDRQIAITLFSIALALLYSVTARSSYLYGWDISGEYRAFTSTRLAGAWSPDHAGDPYGAMLSITVLPAYLVNMTGISGFDVFKYVFPLFGAGVPVCVYLTSRQFLPRRIAALGILFITFQPAWTQMLSGLARQQVALLFFAALVAQIYREESPGTRIKLAVPLSVGLVVSHYSTTYIAVALVLLAILLGACVRANGRALAVDRTTLVIPVLLVAAATVWYIPVTQSASNLSRFTREVSTEKPKSTEAPDAKAGLLHGNQATSLTAEDYEEIVHNIYQKNRPWIRPDPSWTQYRITDARVPSRGERGTLIYSATQRITALANQFAFLLAGLGAVGITISARRCRAVDGVRLGMLSLSGLLLILLMRALPAAAIAYNPERLALQAYCVVNVALMWPLAEKRKLAIIGEREWAIVLAYGLVIAMVVGGSGLLGTLTRAEVRGNLAQEGEDFERFYIHRSEYASATWLASVFHQGDAIAADRYGQLRLIEFTNLSSGITIDLTPPSVDRRAYVYVTETNLKGRARGAIGRQSVLFNFPAAFFGNTKGVVYTNGYSEVLR